MYTATKYIGGDYVPGEILPDGLPEEFLRRMLNAGAIREDAPGVEQTAAPAAVITAAKSSCANLPFFIFITRDYAPFISAFVPLREHTK